MFLNKMTTNYSFGWIRDEPDTRDIPFVSLNTDPLPNKVYLDLPPVYNQGSLGSCVANALCSTFDYIDKKRFNPSRLFLYFNCRKRQSTIDYDSGSSIRMGFKSMNADGICAEWRHPYNVSKFKEPPNLTDYINAKFHKSIVYKSVPRDLNELKRAIADGYPICFGFIVYESFVNDKLWIPKTDPCPVPQKGEKILGGHAVVACGYDDDKECFRIRNSWGTDYGDEGHFLMPYAFITSDDCMDFWVLQKNT